ncbi:MAG: hypothetical protein JXA23_03685 [Bacteroidales bacterium]|nr:hypothetical protein [Bacteroidales bacterium]
MENPPVTGGQADKRTSGQADERTSGQADKRTRNGMRDFPFGLGSV